ncbi:helix-turn-helix domain-containing protein [Oscillospiraceae bacterium 50-16]
MNKDLLTIEDVCKELGVGKNTVYGLVKDKKIKSAKIGKRHLIHRDELQKYIASAVLNGDK